MDLRNARNTADGKSLPFLCRPITSVFLLIILNLQLLPVLSFDGPYSLKTEDDCIKMSNNSHCQCDVDKNSFRVTCPKPAPDSKGVKLQIIMGHAPKDFVKISCFNMNAIDYDLLPKMAIGNLKDVEIYNCLSLGHTPVANILQNFADLSDPVRPQNKYGETEQNADIYIDNDVAHFGHHLQYDDPFPYGRYPFKDLDNHRHYYQYNRNNHHRNTITSTLYEEDTRLPIQLLGPLENLKFLCLSSSNLTFLPTAKNEKLSLHCNELRYLNKTSFECLPNLTELNLTSNSIETLDSNIFDLLTNLANIDLSFNRIDLLPSGLFAYTKNLTQFYLAYNEVPLVSLPKNLLSNLTKLKKIHISCGLQSLTKNIFANSSNVVFISLENNNLTQLPKAMLSDQTSLKTLYLNNNKLMKLPVKLFQNNKKLKVLNLSNNQLRNISGLLFSSLGELKELYLANNRLSIMSSDVFLGNWNLKTLHLQNNFIEFSERNPNSDKPPFHNLNQLQDLILSNNSIASLFIGWKNLSRLRMLDLSHNKINQFDSSLLEYSYMNHLIANLAHNEIKKIDFSNLSSTSSHASDSQLTLDINNNPLNCDCMLLEFIQFLQGPYPDVSENISILPNNLICNAPENLRGKTVSKLAVMELLCPLEQDDSEKLFCPDNCKCWERRIDHTLLVNCNNGNWSKIPKLPDLRDTDLKFTELNMTNNKLVELPLGNQSGYAQVTKLILVDNNLTHLDATRIPSDLTHLDLRYNQLQFLDESIIAFLNESHKFVSLNLSNNPWLCYCEMKPLLKYTQMNYQKITDLSQMQCAAPLTNKFFRQLQFTDICPVDESLKIFLAIAISVITLFGFLIALTAALFYKYEIEIKIWLHARNWCLRFVTEEDLDKDKLYDAFVSYSSLDEEFVRQHLIPKLEQNTPKFRLCLHSRDWLVGDTIGRQIANSVENSRRTIILLSKNFLESTWALLEFRVAHRSALTEKRTRLIVILFGDIGDKDKLDRELRAYINSNIYLEYGDPLFWEKLRYAMPHLSPKIKGLRRNTLENAINESNV